MREAESMRHFVTLLCLGEGDDAVVVGVEERHVLLQRRRPGRSAAVRRRHMAPFSESELKRISQLQFSRKYTTTKLVPRKPYSLTEGHDEQKQERQHTLAGAHRVRRFLLDRPSLARAGS